MSTEQQAPVWDRPEVFPTKPSTGVFGFQNTKGKRISADSLKELSKLIANTKKGVDLVWSPASEYLVAPEELPELRNVLAKRRGAWARNDIADGRRLSLIMGLASLWSGYAAYTNSQGDWNYLINSPTVAITLIMLLIFGLVPWYEGCKELRKSGKTNKLYWDKEIEDARFDSWLSQNLAPFTLILLLLMIITASAQWFGSGKVNWASETVQKVGLLKQTSSTADIWWRYLTAPLVHGNLVHWLMNFAALKYLARRAETLARWPHMLMVFLIAAFVGGMTTVYFVPHVPSVGASGGILGLLGFLLVFETLHKRLVPKSARRRLFAGLVMVGLMGGIGFSFIDNAAHAGGLLAGMTYALLVFPSSTSVSRPEILKQDVVAGGVTLIVLIGATVWSFILLIN